MIEVGCWTFFNVLFILFCCSSSLGKTFFNACCCKFALKFGSFQKLQSLGTTVREIAEPKSIDFAKYLGECASGLFSYGNLEMFLLPHLYSKVKSGAFSEELWII